MDQKSSKAVAVQLALCHLLLIIPRNNPIQNSTEYHNLQQGTKREAQETILPRETANTMLPRYFLTSIHTLVQSIFETISQKGARNPTCETEALLLPVCVLVDLRAQNLLHEVLRIGAVHAPRCRVGAIRHSSSHSSAPPRARRSSKP